MAISKDDLIIKIEVEGEKARKELDKVNSSVKDLGTELKKTTGETAKTNDILDGFGASLIKVQAGIAVAKTAYETYNRTIGETVNAYAMQIESEARLANSLAMTGQFTDETYKGLKQFAAQMEETTTMGDEFALSLASQAIAMGKTEEQTKTLIKATAGLVAVTGKGAGETFNQLLNSYKGSVDELAKFDSSLLSLTNEMKFNGVAVDKLAQKYGKFAEEEAKTFIGAQKQAANALGSLKEEIGGVIAAIFDLETNVDAVKVLYLNLTKAIGENKQTIVTAAKTIGSAFAILGTVVEGIIISAESKFYSMFETVQKGLNMLGLVSDQALAKTSKKVSEIDGLMAENVRALIAGFDELSNGSAVETIDKTTESAKKLQAAFQDTSKGVQSLSQQAQAAVDELNNFFTTAQRRVEGIGAGRVKLLEMEKQAQLDQVKKLAERLEKEGALNDVTKKRLDSIRELVGQEFDKTVAQEKLSVSKELLAQNKALSLDIAAQNATSRDAINMRYQAQLDMLEAKREELAINGLIDDQIASQIDNQKALIESKRDQEVAKAPPPEFEAPLAMGTEIAGMISGSFAGLAGMASGVGTVIAAVDAVLDIIPQMINAITGIINKIVDFPTVIMDAISGLLNSLTRIFTDFPKNLFAALEGIPDMLLSFAEELPTMVTNALEQLPLMLEKLASRLPEFVQRAIKTSITNAPKIAMAFIKYMIKDGPKMAVSITKSLAKELPPAIIQAVKEAVGELLGLVDDFFSNSIPKLEIDTDKMKKDMAKIAGETSALFSVTDLNEDAVRNKIKDDVAAAKEVLDEFYDKLKNFVQKWLIDPLLKAWRWIYDNIIAPFLDLLKKAWLWIYDTILKPIIALFEKAFAWINEKVFQPILTAFSNVFTWIKEKVFDNFASVISSVFNFVKSVFDKAVEGIQWVFNNVGTLFTKVIEGFEWVFGHVKKYILDPVKDGFEGIFNGLKSAFEFIKKPFEALADALKMFKVPEWLGGGSGGGGGGVVGKIGSALGFADGGIVPGKALVSGDSLVNDKILAMLSPGEAVIPRSVMQNPEAAEIIRMLLDGQGVKRFALGGSVEPNSFASSSSSIPLFQPVNNMTTNRTNQVVNYDIKMDVKLNTTMPVDEKFVRDKLMPEIKKSLRRETLDGKLVVSNRGVFA